MYTFFIWLSFNNESPLVLTDFTSGSFDVSQSAGTGIYSIESNLIISLGETVNKYFQMYPSPLSPALDGSRSTKRGSS